MAFPSLLVVLNIMGRLTEISSQNLISGKFKSSDRTTLICDSIDSILIRPYRQCGTSTTTETLQHSEAVTVLQQFINPTTSQSRAKLFQTVACNRSFRQHVTIIADHVANYLIHMYKNGPSANISHSLLPIYSFKLNRALVIIDPGTVAVRHRR